MYSGDGPVGFVHLVRQVILISAPLTLDIEMISCRLYNKH